MQQTLFHQSKTSLCEKAKPSKAPKPVVKVAASNLNQHDASTLKEKHQNACNTDQETHTVTNSRISTGGTRTVTSAGPAPAAANDEAVKAASAVTLRCGAVSPPAPPTVVSSQTLCKTPKEKRQGAGTRALVKFGRRSTRSGQGVLRRAGPIFGKQAGNRAVLGMHELQKLQHAHFRRAYLRRVGVVR